jgi:hypothetical protein
MRLIDILPDLSLVPPNSQAKPGMGLLLLLLNPLRLEKISQMQSVFLILNR